MAGLLISDAACDVYMDRMPDGSKILRCHCKDYECPKKGSDNGKFTINCLKTD